MSIDSNIHKIEQLSSVASKCDEVSVAVFMRDDFIGKSTVRFLTSVYLGF